MITLEFRDPGMPRLSVEVADVQAALAEQAQKHNYTRCYIWQGRRQRLRYVRELGASEWKDWETMNWFERGQWELQDRGD